MTNAAGAITYARSYDPGVYPERSRRGVVAQTGGVSQTAYGYTGEYQDSAGMVYLRARHYAPEMGRFLARDTWEGNARQPMSYNLWNYVNSSPIIYTDPTGHAKGCMLINRLGAAKRIVPKVEGDYMATYTAAGIAVQCIGGGWEDWKATEYDGEGWAQISQKQAEIEYGKPVYWYKDGVLQRDENDRPIIRGYGLCTGVYDFRPNDEAWSAEFMRRGSKWWWTNVKTAFAKKEINSLSLRWLRTVQGLLLRIWML